MVLKPIHRYLQMQQNRLQDYTPPQVANLLQSHTYGYYSPQDGTQIPHHTIGSQSENIDELPMYRILLKVLASRQLSSHQESLMMEQQTLVQEPLQDRYYRISLLSSFSFPVLFAISPSPWLFLSYVSRKKPWGQYQ